MKENRKYCSTMKVEDDNDKVRRLWFHEAEQI
jgi:hypothetical protein